MTTKARTGQQRGRTNAQEEQALIELLSGGLSDEEIQRVLACALLVLEKPGLDQLITRLGEETGGTLRSLLESRHASHRKSPQQSLPIAGSAKIHQEWEKTWREWHACITESGDEKGKYILQEHHWEEPYLDTSALAEDLELIAARMRPLLARVMDEELDPDFGFANEIGLTVEEIGLGLPEWMDPSQYEECAFGPEVTGCLLEWEWRAAQRDEMSAFEFVDTIRQLEHEANGISFNQDTISTFILECDEVAQRGILQGIVAHRNAPHWEYVLGSPYSGWFLLYQELCQRWDPALYLDSCRQNIARDWELALPVITDLLDQQAFAEAQPFVEQAVRALLQLKEGETWNPHEALLIYHLTRQYSGERNVRLVPLFESWIKITQALGQEEQTYALQLQLSLCQQWEDWDAAFAAFQKLPASKLTGIRDRLFADWRALVVDASLGSRYDRLESPQVTWVHGLVDAAWAGNKGAAVFRRAMQEWLKEIVRTPAVLQQSLDALGQLTLDLDADSQLRKTAPTLHGLLSSSLWVDNTTVGVSRRRWIERLGAAALFPEVLTFWKRHAARLIPDPAQASGSNYDHCAEWLAAFSELDTQAAEKILQEWSATHHRRRNLWKALAARGLPRVDTA